MSLPVHLGVRFYQIVSAMDRYVTQWVDDISYRSVAPGGFASANITLRVPRGAGPLTDPDPLGFSRLTDLFTRVQVVDLRTMEITWEGRIEDPARQVEPGVWQIGALGSMVSATDVERPVLYVDSSVDGWNGDADAWWEGDGSPFSPADYREWENKKETEGKALFTKYLNDAFVGFDPDHYFQWRWDSHGYDQPIARITTSHNGYGPSDAQDQNFSVVVGILANLDLDVTGFETASATKSNVIGTDFTDQNVRVVMLGVRRDSGTGNYSITGSDNMQAKWWSPKVVGLRLDRTGAKLVTASSYPGDYVTVSQVVEDVVGRFLVGGWYDSALNTPWAGSVRAADAYIDTSDTTQITDLKYPDGATAAQILSELIEKVQTNAYWAIWESQWGAANPEEDYGARQGFRFEFATWPTNWGYLATSQDGFEGQPNGEDLSNFVFYRYRDTADLNAWHVTTGWHGDEMAPELLTGGFTRAVTVSKEEPTSGTAAGTLRTAYLNSRKKTLNAGTLTVKRPIYFYDDGSTGAGGASRMLDPWMIRPGKLVRITDIPPRTMSNDLRTQPSTPSAGIDGTLFKVVATEYNSADNSCRMELDQVTRWKVSTQIAKTNPRSRLVVK